MEAKMDKNKAPITIGRETEDGIWMNGDKSIFNPIKDKINAKPYFNLENMWMEFANKKYIDLNPNIANILDV